MKVFTDTFYYLKIRTISATDVTAQYRTASGSDRMLPLYQNRNYQRRVELVIRSLPLAVLY